MPNYYIKTLTDYNGNYIYPQTVAEAILYDGSITLKQQFGKYLPLSGGTLTGNVTAPVFIGRLQGNADTASRLEGFSSSSTGNATWGVQTGSTIITWNESAGGSIDFRRNCPNTGQLSMKVDGRFYQDEGRYLCLDTNNFKSYAPTLTGAGASGTWNINVTGSSGSTRVNSSTGKAYAVGAPSAGDGNKTLVYNPNIYTQGNVLYGAAWNDYAEYREVLDDIEPGRCVCENGDGSLSISKKRLQGGANIVSDTFGFAIGETEKATTPLAVSGRVLVFPYEDKDSYQPGDAVCAGPNGTVSKMTRLEIIKYPERIIGTISEIPTYETWGPNNVKINGRIWIKIR